MLFHVIPEAIAITRKKGVFRQVKVYYRKDRIYVAYGNGFIYVTKNGSSVPDISIVDIDVPFKK